MIDLDDFKSYAAAVATAGALFAVVIRPRIPAALWARFGVVGEIVDVLCGNYGHAANVLPDNGNAQPLPKDAPL